MERQSSDWLTSVRIRLAKSWIWNFGAARQFSQACVLKDCNKKCTWSCGAPKLRLGHFHEDSTDQMMDLEFWSC